MLARCNAALRLFTLVQGRLDAGRDSQSEDADSNEAAASRKTRDSSWESAAEVGVLGSLVAPCVSSEVRCVSVGRSRSAEDRRREQ